MPLTPQAAARKDERTGLAHLEHRHYATIATIITRMSSFEEWTYDRIVDHFADELEATNPKFDRKRFLRACGL